MTMTMRMVFKKTSLVIIMMILIFSTIIFGKFPSTNVFANANDTWTASTGFSSNQGWYQWSYRQLNNNLSNGTTLSDLTWDASNNRWQGNATYTLVGNNWQHPDANASVRTWTAPYTGIVSITGNPKKNVSGGNGVNVAIRGGYNGTVAMWGPHLIQGNDLSGRTHDIKWYVKQGEKINFIVDSNGDISHDTTGWDPTIIYSDAYQATENFSSTQGLNQWYYKEWNGTSYVNMTWDSTNNWWQGAAPYSIISSSWQAPNAANDSAREWVAPKSGTINISGVVKKYQSGGNGVIITILKNNTVIWGPQTINGTDTIGTSFYINANVNAGDGIYFRVNSNGSDISYDNTSFDPRISYGGDTLAGDGWKITNPSLTAMSPANGVYEDSGQPFWRDSSGNVWAVLSNTISGNGKLKIWKGTTTLNMTYQYDANLNFSTGAAGIAFNNVNYPDGPRSRGQVWPMGFWIDPSTGTWYCFFHNETGWSAGGTGYTTKGPIEGEPDFRHIGLMTSTDQGHNWDFNGWVVTGNLPSWTTEYVPDAGLTGGQTGGTYQLGAGDFSLYVDSAGGYMYLFYTISYNPKSPGNGGGCGIYVARASISSKGLPGNWYKYYNGSFSQPGNSGLETPVLEGSNAEPHISYNSYLGKYIMVSYSVQLWNSNTGTFPAVISYSTDLVNWTPPKPLDISRTDLTQAPYMTIVNSDNAGDVYTTGKVFTLMFNGNATSVSQVSVIIP